MLYAGFKGWKMVQTHHIGVDAPSDAEISAEKEEVKNANEIFSESSATPKRGFAEQQQNEKTR